MPFIPSQSSHTYRQRREPSWLDISDEDSFSSLSEEVEAIRRALEMYSNARPVASYEDDVDLEGQEEERRQRRAHLRGTLFDEVSPYTINENEHSNSNEDLFTSNQQNELTNLSEERPRPVGRRNRPSRLSQALSEATEGDGNHYQLILNRTNNQSGTTITTELPDGIADNNSEIPSYFHPAQPPTVTLPLFDFEQPLDSQRDNPESSQRTFVRRVLQPQENGISWLLAEIRHDSNTHRRSRLSTMTTARNLEEDSSRSLYNQILNQHQQLESLSQIVRNQRSQEIINNSGNGEREEQEVEAALEDGGMSDTTVTPSSAVLLTDSVLDGQVRFMMRLQQLQEHIGAETDHSEAGNSQDRERFQLPTSEERHTFQRLSRNYEDSFNRRPESSQPNHDEPSFFGSPLLQLSRPELAGPPTFLPLGDRGHRHSSNPSKLYMARCCTEDMTAKAVSWVRRGVKFGGRLVSLPARGVNNRDRYSVIAHYQRECEIEFRIRLVDCECNRVSCVLKRKCSASENMETEEIWEGEMLDGPRGPHNSPATESSEDDEPRKPRLYNITQYWQQLYPNHTLNGTSMLWRVHESHPAKASPSRSTTSDYASPYEMLSKASHEYVWLLLHSVNVSIPPSQTQLQTPHQLLLSVRRSDGVIEGCLGKSASDMMLMYLRPEQMSRRGGLPDISLR